MEKKLSLTETHLVLEKDSIIHEFPIEDVIVMLENVLGSQPEKSAEELESEFESKPE